MTRRLCVLPGLVFAALLVSSRAHAQAPIVVDPATVAVTFNSADHASSDMANYQAILLDAAADAASGVPLQTGPLVPKSSVAVIPATSPADYRLTFAQLGIAVPSCGLKQATCPQYTVVLLAVDTNNKASARGVLAESAPFQAGSTAVQVVGPTNVRVR